MVEELECNPGGDIADFMLATPENAFPGLSFGISN
jgi:hypothetical protein